MTYRQSFYVNVAYNCFQKLFYFDIDKESGTEYPFRDDDFVTMKAFGNLQPRLEAYVDLLKSNFKRLFLTVFV